MLAPLADVATVLLGFTCALGALAVPTAVALVVWGLVEERRERAALARLERVGAAVSSAPRASAVERPAA